MIDLATLATSLPDVTEGVACAGTALESRTYSTNKKAFLFLSEKEVRLELDASGAAAKALGFAVGANGWARLPIDALPSASVLKKWVRESHALMAGPARATGGAKRSTKRSKGR
jgi:hypothetical protein